MGVSNFSAQRTGIALAAMVNAIRSLFTDLGMVVTELLGSLKYLPIISASSRFYGNNSISNTQRRFPQLQILEQVLGQGFFVCPYRRCLCKELRRAPRLNHPP